MNNNNHKYVYLFMNDSAGHIQVGQVPGRHEPDEKGEINFPFFFKTLAALGYDGWIGCEYVPAGSYYSVDI